MTRAEFNEWIEREYDNLLAVASRRARSPERAQDAVHQAVKRALESEVFSDLEPAKAWPWMTDAVRSVLFDERRGEKRAGSVVGRAGAFLNSRGSRVPPATKWRHEVPVGGEPVPLLHGLEAEPEVDVSPRAWFAGPYGWRSIGASLPRLKPPAPDAPFAEYSIQPDGKCPRCEARTVVRLNRGRDYDKVHGRLPRSFYVATCLNGHEFTCEPTLTSHEFGSSWNNDKPERPRQFWERFDGGKALPSMESIVEDARRPRW